MAPPPTFDFLSSHAGILVFLGLIVAFLVGMLTVWAVIRPSRRSEEKEAIYECGEDPKGSPWVQFNIRFYVFALVFIIFDVEAVFLLPWAVVYHGMVRCGLGPVAFVEGLVFILILTVALVYVWRKGDLEWVRAEDRL